MVDAGAHVSPGQTVIVSAALGQEALAREIAAASYDRGAHQVQVDYMDPHVRRARLERAPEPALGEVIPWVRQRPGQMAEMRATWIGLSGPTAPGLLDDLDPGRFGRDTVALVEWSEVIDRGEVSWSSVAGPNEAWARFLFGDSEPDPLAALWERIATVCRLDEPAPAAVGWQRSAELQQAADRLSSADLDSLRFRGPGTDLTVGLSWHGGGVSNAEGHEHVPNLPTEEVFTSPNPDRIDGTVAHEATARVRARRPEYCGCGSRLGARSRSTPTRARR